MWVNISVITINTIVNKNLSLSLNVEYIGLFLKEEHQRYKQFAV